MLPNVSLSSCGENSLKRVRASGNSMPGDSVSLAIDACCAGVNNPALLRALTKLACIAYSVASFVQDLGSRGASKVDLQVHVPPEALTNAIFALFTSGLFPVDAKVSNS